MMFRLLGRTVGEYEMLIHSPSLFAPTFSSPQRISSLGSNLTTDLRRRAVLCLHLWQTWMWRASVKMSKSS